MQEKVTETQVLVIGGGIVGTAITRELSKYKVDVCMVEKEPAAGFGISKGSQGILHSGMGLQISRLVKWFDRTTDARTYLTKPMRAKEKFNIAGYQSLIDLAPFMNEKILNCQALYLANEQAELDILEICREVATDWGYKGITTIDRKQVQDMEPALNSSKWIGAVYDPNEYIIIPTQWAIAFADNARQNGAHTLFNTEVKGIEEKKGYYLVKTNNGSIKAEWVINVAGLFSDEIAAMVDKIDWSFFMIRCPYLVVENKNYFSHFLMDLPGIHYQLAGRLMVPTPDGNVLVSNGSDEIDDKYAFNTRREALEDLSRIPYIYMPDVPWHKNLIRHFVGVMHFNTKDHDDYLIYWPKERFLNLIVCPPGMGPSVGMAQEIPRMLGAKGLDLVEKSDFNPYRDKEPRFIELTTEEKNEKIRANPAYGHIVCRCQKTCEQEVREAVRKGAKTLDEIKFETMAGFGRCQGGFCTSRVLKIMSEELGISPLEITKKGRDSYILKHETKELTERRGK